MSWDKGDKNEKDVRTAEFVAAITGISEELMRHGPEVGIAGLAYMVALTRVLKPKIPFDKMVAHYTVKIEVQMDDAVQLLRQRQQKSSP